MSVALAIIDSDGIDALSMRRLGRELQVNGASLYHHFRDKDEILRAVRRKALASVTVPADRSVEWQECCVSVALSFRAALRAHPNVASLMVTTSSRQLSAPVRNFMAGVLREQGISPVNVYAVLDSFSTLAFGSVMFNVGVDQAALNYRCSNGDYADLAIALDDDRFDADQRFEAMAWALAAGWAHFDEVNKRSVS